MKKNNRKIDSFGLHTIEFNVPKMNHNYGKGMERFLHQCGIGFMHFTAQYNIPDGFDFPFSVTVHDVFNQHFITHPIRYKKTIAPLLKKISVFSSIPLFEHVQIVAFFTITTC